MDDQPSDESEAQGWRIWRLVICICCPLKLLHQKREHLF